MLLNIPKPSLLSGRTVNCPFIFVDVLLLSKNIMKPYPGTYEKCTVETIFNFSICKTGRVVENAFGIMVSVFKKRMNMEQNKATKVTLVSSYIIYIITSS